MATVTVQPLNTVFPPNIEVSTAASTLTLADTMSAATGDGMYLVALKSDGTFWVYKSGSTKAPPESATYIYIASAWVVGGVVTQLIDRRRVQVSVDSVNAAVPHTIAGDGSPLADGIVTVRTLSAAVMALIGAQSSLPSTTNAVFHYAFALSPELTADDGATVLTADDGITPLTSDVAAGVNWWMDAGTDGSDFEVCVPGYAPITVPHDGTSTAPNTYAVTSGTVYLLAYATLVAGVLTLTVTPLNAPPSYNDLAAAYGKGVVPLCAVYGPGCVIGVVGAGSTGTIAPLGAGSGLAA